MSTLLIAALLVGIAALAYGLWTAVEQIRERKTERLLAEKEALGDEAVPDSIHPQINLDVCMGSGSCVRACPEKDVLRMGGGVVHLANPLACIGHGACVAACPVKAIKLVFGSARRGVELPQVDPSFQTTRPGVYVIGELSGMGLIRNAISQGKQAADHVIASGRRGEGDALDAVVVGAGPAGISATLRLLEAGLRVLCVERESFGGTIMHYPRAKVVMTGDLEIPMFGKVKRRTMRKEELVEIWDCIKAQTPPPVVTGELVTELRPDGRGGYIVVGERGEERRAANVLLALGRRGSPRKLGVPGEELPKVAYRLLEPSEFRGRHVLVVGGGNSAVECALALAEQGRCASVSISYRRPQFGRCRPDNRTAIDRAIRAGQVRALLPSEVAAIRPQDVVLKSGDVLPNDAVVVQIGGTPPGQILQSFGVAVVTKYGEA